MAEKIGCICLGTGPQCHVITRPALKTCRWTTLTILIVQTKLYMLIMLTTLRTGRFFSRGSMTTGASAEDVRFSDLLAVFHPSESFRLQCSLKLVSEMAGKSQLSTCTVHIHWAIEHPALLHHAPTCTPLLWCTYPAVSMTTCVSQTEKVKS